MANDLRLAEQAACSVPDHKGENYLTVLDRLHSELCPKSYLEIEPDGELRCALRNVLLSLSTLTSRLDRRSWNTSRCVPFSG
jgi:hypothetical protein